MKKASNYILIAFATLMLSSCAMHTGYMQGSASLSSANFSYTNMSISGEATAKYILSIGGLSKKTLVENAKAEMLKRNPLQANQALANVTVNFKHSFYFGVYEVVTCTIAADVVTFR